MRATSDVGSQDGYLLGDWYWEEASNTSRDIAFSVSKSYTSALIGIAEGLGLLSSKDNASKYIKEWRNSPSSQILITDLLSMDSGRHWTFTADYVTSQTKLDQTSYAVGLGVDHPPGKWWEYNNMAVQTLEEILRVVTGGDPTVFAQKSLFEPIGDTRTTWKKDSTGYLWLNNGTWAEEKQVVPYQYVRDSVQASTKLNDIYGYLWWLIGKEGHWVLPSTPKRREGNGFAAPGCSVIPGGYAAMGAEGQFIMVDPVRKVYANPCFQEAKESLPCPLPFLTDSFDYDLS
eukprot:gene5473-978_t